MEGVTLAVGNWDRDSPLEGRREGIYHRNSNDKRYSVACNCLFPSAVLSVVLDVLDFADVSHSILDTDDSPWSISTQRVAIYPYLDC